MLRHALAASITLTLGACTTGSKFADQHPYEAAQPLRAFVVPTDRDPERPWSLDPSGCLRSITLSSSVLFETNSATLSAPAIAALETATANLCAATSATALGATDDRGGELSNLALSRRRARSVAQWLVTHRKMRVTAVGISEADPVASNDTPEGRALNRRVVVTIDTPKGTTNG